jgi:glucose/arabinose dehydrogenase
MGDKIGPRRFRDFSMIFWLFLAGIWLLLEPGMGPGSAQAQTWPNLTLTQIPGALTQPTSITHAGDGTPRIFVTEQPGRIRIIKNGVLLGTPFLDLTARIGIPGGEQGLLSVAFPPGYGTTRNRFYVYYTNPAGTLVIARYRPTANADVADPNSEEIILTIDHPAFSNHNGGQLQFGPDGFLYIGTGDGGGGGDPSGNAQNPAVLLGKLLRIDVEPVGNPFVTLFRIYLPTIFQSGVAPNYRIPPNNPYVGTPGYRGEIWALGLRNPWRFSFDRQTGDLYIGDVGQGLWEEVDFQPKSSAGGENYGWNILEGMHCFNPAVGCIPPPRYSPPVAEYPHNPDCSITGGYVYRGPDALSAMQGIYFYGDICSGTIRGLQRFNNNWVSTPLTTNTAPFGISTFGEDQAGNLYMADYGGGGIALGRILRITNP